MIPGRLILRLVGTRLVRRYGNLIIIIIVRSNAFPLRMQIGYSCADFLQAANALGCLLSATLNSKKAICFYFDHSHILYCQISCYS